MADEESTEAATTTTPAAPTVATTTATASDATVSTTSEPQQSEAPKGQPSQEQQFTRIVTEALKPISEKLAALDQVATATSTEEKPVSQIDIDALSAKYAAESKTWAVEKALMLADCIDTVGALAHVTMDDVVLADDGTLTGIDTQKLKESHPHLFKAAASAATVSTGATSTGAPASGQAKTIKEGLAALKTQGA